MKYKLYYFILYYYIILVQGTKYLLRSTNVNPTVWKFPYQLESYDL